MIRQASPPGDATRSHENSRKRLILPVAVLAILPLLVFWPTLRYGFVQIDDALYVSGNPHVARGLTGEGLRWAFTSLGYAGNWHPLTWLSHMTDVQLFGLDAGKHHLMNLILHLANTLLLFLVLAAGTASVWRSAFVAAAFAVHPLHVESVVWVAERKDVLSTFFWLLTLGAWLRWVRNPGRLRYLAVVVFYCLALMAKPMPVTLPFLLLLLDFWPLNRWRPEKTGQGFRSGAALLREKIPLLALAGASGLATFLAQSRSGYVISAEVYPLGVRLANAAWSYALYLQGALLPAGLAVFYPHPGSSLSWWAAGGAAGLLVALGIAAILLGRRTPCLPVGWLWFLGTLVPVIGLVQVGDQARADRYTYVPLIGIFIIAAWGLPSWLSRRPRGVPALTAGGAAIIAALALTATHQVAYWRDDLTLFQRTVAVTRENWQAHSALGLLLSREGRRREAVLEFNKALAIRPGFAEGYNNLGTTLAEMGDLERAIACYRRALQLRPAYPEAHFNLGVDLIARGDLPAARASLARAVALKPDYVKAHVQLGRVLALEGRYAQAIPHYREALRHQPDHREAQRDLRVALAALGRTR